MYWRIELFGGLRATYGAETLAHFRSRKTAALLAYLAFFRGPHPRDKLVEMLWPDFPLEAGRNSLRVALADLRRRSTVADESGVVVSPPLLQQDRGSIGLRIEVTTDVADFEKAVDEARRALSPEVRVAAYERAQSLYRGKLLEGLYEDWIPIEEARLEASFLYVLNSLRGFYDNAGDTLRAFELAQLAARLDPQQQRQSSASRHKKESLHASKKEEASKGNLASTSNSSENAKSVAPVPTAFTRFFGREAELRELATRLLEGQTRLLTITGGGGLGKTRLALELARQLERPLSSSQEEGMEARFDRVFWVPLADVSEAGRLPEDLIKVLNLTIEVEGNTGNRANLLEAIAGFLHAQSSGGTRVLLVLDNFEQLLPEGAVFLGELLENVPGLALLVTSRQRLNLTGEWEHRIEALALPSPTFPNPPEAESDTSWNAKQLAMLRSTSSVLLFADRARGARTDWRLLPREVPTLVALLHRLEGVPLAIELVASRSGVLSLDQMLSRLSQSLQWVCSRDQHRPLRHRSLHAVLEWSLRLLPAPEREIFARLSVFHGGWTLEDACAVLSDVDPDDLLESLQSLRDASLISSDESSGGQLRFSMLEMVRQIASERLDEEELLRTRRSHAEFYFQLAHRASKNPQDYQRRGIWGATEGANFSAALDFWASENLGGALEMAASLWWYWIFNYHLPEGRHCLRELLAHPQTGEFPVERAQAQGCAAYIALLSGYHDEMDELLHAALNVWQQDEYKRERAAAFNLLGALAVTRGEKGKARDFYAQSLALHREVSGRHELTIAINALAGAERDCGHGDAARRLCAEALQIAEQEGDKGAESWVYHTLGLLAFDDGDLTKAREYQEKSLTMRRGFKHLQGQAACLDALGDVVVGEGHIELARNYYREALEIWEQIKQSPKAQVTEKKLKELKLRGGLKSRAG